jgi:hypothetical protein
MRLASYRLYQLGQAFLLFSSSTLLCLHKITTTDDLMLWPLLLLKLSMKIFPKVSSPIYLENTPLFCPGFE